MKKKQFIASMVATVLSVSMLLGGCGQTAGTASETTSTEASTKSEGEAKASKKDGKITIFQSKTEIMTELNKLAKAYEDETGITVEVWETTGDNYYADLKTSLSTQAGATLFSLQPGAESIELADYLADLGSLSFVNKIGAGMTDEVNGKVVGIPYTVEGFGLVYNKELVDAAGFKSVDDLVDFLAKSDAENALGLSQEDYFLIAHILNAPFAVQDNPAQYFEKVMSGEERMADNDAFVEFAKLMEAIRSDCKNPVDITYDNNCGDFATGKTAMIHQGNWCTSMFADYDVNFDMSLAAVPVCGNKAVSVSVPIAWYLNVDASEDEQALAKDFLEWLYTSETGVDFMMNKCNFIPVTEGMENTNLDPINQAVSEAVISGNTIPWVMSSWPAGIVTTDLSPITKEFFTSDMSGMELVDKLNDAFVNAAQ